jgi:hypothetical protein
MATTTTTTNKPLNPRAQDLSPKGYNRAALFSGKALDFDGVNDQITITNGLNAIAGNRITITAWVRLDAGTNYYPSIIANKVNGADGFCLLLTPDEKIFFQYDGTGQQIEDGGTIEVGRTYFLTATYDGTNLKTYINGTLTATSATATGKAVAAAGDLTIYVGTQDTGVGYWNGLIAGVRVFNTALTAAQVADLYLNPEKITPDGVATSALKLWLPMMEGAGASAYDGSGNGNDGTINGATWTAGVGAPVAQTALVSWNKGINLVQYSEAFDNAAWNKDYMTATANAIAAPNGTTTADTLSNNTTNATHRFYQSLQAFTGTGALSFSVYLKYKDHRYISYGLTDDSQYRAQIVVDLLNGTITDNFVDGSTTITSSTLTALGDGWYKLSATINATGAWLNNLYVLGVMLNQSTFTSAGYAGTGTGVYIWGAQANIGTAQPYIKTNATAQTSAVLVPEGLTAGASIFGTDIITPRNAFALNLDGASWAQVGDNASVDLQYPATLEIWTYQFGGELSANNKYVPLFDKAPTSNGGGGITLRRYSQTELTTYGYLGIGGSFLTYGSLTYNAWNHIVAVVDTNSQKIYVNGTLVINATNSWTLSTNSEPMRMGYAPTDGVQYFYGSLANPRIYNRALTAAEVLRNYNADKAKFGL